MARNACKPGGGVAPCPAADTAASWLKAQLPERARQIDELLCNLGGPFDPLPMVLVCGPRATGKSSIVREALSRLGRPHAWASLAQGSNQCLMEGILAQLARACRPESNATTGGEGRGEEQIDWRRQSASIGKFLDALPRAILGGAELPLSRAERALEEDSRENSQEPDSPSNFVEVTLGVSQGPAAPGSPRHTRPISALDSKAKSKKRLFSGSGEGRDPEPGLPGRDSHSQRDELPVQKSRPDAMPSAESPVRTRLQGERAAALDGAMADDGARRPEPQVGAEPQVPRCDDARGGKGDDAEPTGPSQENGRGSVGEEGGGAEQGTGARSVGTEPERDPTVLAPLVVGRRGRPVVHRAPTVYIVIDNVELAAAGSSEKGIDDGMALLRALARAQEHTGLQNLGVVLIGCVGRATLMWGLEVAAEPVAVLFPAYSETELLAILERQRPGNKLFAAFLRQVGPVFIRLCRSLPELDAMLGPLWETYSSAEGSHATEGGDAAALDDPRLAAKLFGKVQGRIPMHLADPLRSMLGLWEGDMSAPSTSSSARDKELIDMPALTKFALLAAYICSRNPASVDETLFADKNGPKRQKRSRKDSSLTKEKKEREVREGQQTGPAPFSLRRWLDVCCSVVVADGGAWVCHPHAQLPTARPSASSSHALRTKDPAAGGRKGNGHRIDGARYTACLGKDDEEALEHKEGEFWGREDLLMQVATLVDTGLVGRSRDDPLDLGAKYWCRSDVDFVTKVAKSLNFPLKRYLLYG